MRAPIPFGGLRIRPISSNPLEDGDDYALDPHYFVPLEAWHLKSLGSVDVLGVHTANLFLVAEKLKGGAHANYLSSYPHLNPDDWLFDEDRVFLDLDEAKAYADSRYKAQRLVRVYACPTLVFPTADHLLVVLNLNTATPFADLGNLVGERGARFPRTIAGVGKLLSNMERHLHQGEFLVKGLISKEQLEASSLVMTSPCAPVCQVHVRKYSKRRPLPAAALTSSEAELAQRSKEARAEWDAQAWDVTCDRLNEVASVWAATTGK